MQTVIYYYKQTLETNILGHCYQRVFDIAERQQEKKVRINYKLALGQSSSNVGHICFIFCGGVTIIYHAILHRDVFRDQMLLETDHFISEAFLYSMLKSW